MYEGLSKIVILAWQKGDGGLEKTLNLCDFINGWPQKPMMLCSFWKKTNSWNPVKAFYGDCDLRLDFMQSEKFEENNTISVI